MQNSDSKDRKAQTGIQKECKKNLFPKGTKINNITNKLLKK